MPEIVRERDGFGQIFIEAQGARNGAADRCNFDGVSQPRAQMVAGAVEENLRLVFQTTKGSRMNDASPIALEFGSISVRRLGKSPAAGFS